MPISCRATFGARTIRPLSKRETPGTCLQPAARPMEDSSQSAVPPICSIGAYSGTSSTAFRNGFTGPVQGHGSWAPEISHYKGAYRLYYAYSLFGKNTSGIALATNKTLDRKSPAYKWVDRGLVLRSTVADDYNAIDPNFVVDRQGRSWLDFGSFWGGIKMRRLNADGKPSPD